MRWIVTESEWYCSIIPIVLVNDAHSIGTDYSTDIVSCDPSI